MKACIFLNGTSATSKQNPQGFLQGVLHPMMYSKTNIITELHDNCLQSKLNLDGPGTDLFQDSEENLSWTAPLESASSTLGGSILTGIGAASGNFGDNSVWSNLAKVKDFILDQYGQMDPNDNELQLDVFGWSRGAYTALLVKKAIKDLQETGEIPKNKKLSLNVYAIDPVPGGPDDRFHLPVIDDPPGVDVTCVIYYSDTGNIKPAAGILKKLKINMPFFSGLDDTSENTEKYLFQTDHESIAGKSRHEKDTRDRYVGDIVIADIVASASARGVSFEPEWRRQVLEAGDVALQKYVESKPSPATSRKFLDPKAGIWAKYFGKKIEEVSNIRPVTADLLTKKPAYQAMLTERGEQRINALVQEMRLTLKESGKKKMVELQVSILPNLTKVEINFLHNEIKLAYTDPQSKLRDLCKKEGFFAKIWGGFGKTPQYKQALTIIKKEESARQAEEGQDLGRVKPGSKGN